MEAILPDGARVHYRPLRAGDHGRVLRGIELLSHASLDARFLASGYRRERIRLDWLERLGRDVAVGACDPLSGEPVGLARYVVADADEGVAEVAITIVDAWQGRGVGTVLLALLTREAEASGITTFVGTARADNRGARALARSLGPPALSVEDHGVIEWSFAVRAGRASHPQPAYTAA